MYNNSQTQTTPSYQAVIEKRALDLTLRVDQELQMKSSGKDASSSTAGRDG